MTARAADRARYDRATAQLDAPVAIVDLEAFDANADDLVRRAGGKPVRVASKSVRCRALLERVLARDGFAGIMSFTLAESLWLARSGFDDVLLAYPSADRKAFSELAGDPKLAAAVTVMVDDPAQLRLIDEARQGGTEVVRVCLELDTSLKLLGGRVRVGARRSPLHSAAQVADLARAVARTPGFRLVGIMAYEGHIAGVGDAVAGRPVRSRAVRLMQAAARKELAQRRADVVRAVRAVAPDLEFVNGGGTGSVQHTAAEDAVTEIAAGSGLYVPRLFDNYTSFSGRPAALFAQPVVRRPGSGGDRAGRRLPRVRRGWRRPAAGPLPPGGTEVRPPGGTRRGADASAGLPRRRSAHRRQGVVPARQGGRAVRAVRRAPSRRGRRGDGDRADVPGRGAHVSVEGHTFL